MEYVHVRKLSQYHPGYKDRELNWAKVKFNIIAGDPDLDLVKNEVDKYRFIAMICLELRAKKPLPNDDKYWNMFFEIKKRPMSLTLKVLHNFLSIGTDPENSADTTEKPELASLDDVTQLSGTPPQSRVEESRVEESTVQRVHLVAIFEDIWKYYPNRSGKKNALRHFLSTVKSDDKAEEVRIALKNYLESYNYKRGYVKNGSTWFNEWQDWVSPTEHMMKGGGVNAGTEKRNRPSSFEGEQSKLH